MKQKKNIEYPVKEEKSFFKFFFPEQANQTSLYLLLTLLAYSALVFWGVLHHEMWRDETEPWLIGSFSESLSDFFSNMKMGSNPYIWYLILHFASKITVSTFIVQLIHILFGIGAVYIFLRHAPFSFPEKLLFVFGYYVVFEYGIISRGYSLTIFFLFLFCAYYKKYWHSTIPLAVIIFFLANATGGFGAILSISLLIFLLANFYFDEMAEGKRKIKIKHTGWTVILILFSIYVAWKSISPPEDSVYNTKWHIQFDSDRFLNVLWRCWSGFIPIPDLLTVNFWNTNFLNKEGAGSLTKIFLTLFSVFFIAFNTLLFSRKISVLLFYLAATSGVLFFSYTNISIFIINGTRYNGFCFIVFFVALWIFRYFPEKTKPKISFLYNLSEKLSVPKFQKPVLYLFLSANLFAAIVALWKDYKYDFSSVKKTGKYIVENNLHRFPVTGYVDYAVSPVSAYIRKPIYFPDRDTTSPFPVWSVKKYTTDINQAMNRMLAKIASFPDTSLVILSFDLNASLIGDIRFVHLADFKGSIVNDENFSIYLAYKYDLRKVLESGSEIKVEELQDYIAIALSLLNQNKTDECEKLLLKIKDKATEKEYPGFYQVMGMLCFKKNMLNEAKKAFHKEIDLKFQQDHAYFQLGMIYYNEQKSDSAIWAWEKTISLNSAYLDAYNNLGVCYLNFRNDRLKAEEYWNKTIQINPDYVQGYLNLMLLCQNKKDENCLLNYLRILLKKGVSVDDIRNRGINISNEMLSKANS